MYLVILKYTSKWQKSSREIFGFTYSKNLNELLFFSVLLRNTWQLVLCHDGFTYVFCEIIAKKVQLAFISYKYNKNETRKKEKFPCQKNLSIYFLMTTFLYVSIALLIAIILLHITSLVFILQLRSSVNLPPTLSSTPITLPTLHHCKYMPDFFFCELFFFFFHSESKRSYGICTSLTYFTLLNVFNGHPYCCI